MSRPHEREMRMTYVVSLLAIGVCVGLVVWLGAQLEALR